MVRPYRGKGSVSRQLEDLRGSPFFLTIKMEPCRVHFFSKIFEAYTHMALIIPVNTREGLIAVFATPDTISEVEDIIYNFPYPVNIVE